MDSIWQAIVGAGMVFAAIGLALWRAWKGGKEAQRVEVERARAEAVDRRKESDDDIAALPSADVDRSLGQWMRD